MTDGPDKKSEGRCLLLVEDEYIIADDLALSLERLGFEIVGPAGSVARGSGPGEPRRRPARRSRARYQPAG